MSAAEHAGAKLMAENALEGGLYSEAALTRMLGNSKHFSTITLLRLNDSLFLPGEPRTLQGVCVCVVSNDTT